MNTVYNQIYFKASVKYTAEVHADVPWGTDKKSKFEFFVQAVNDLNEEMETLEKANNFLITIKAPLLCLSNSVHSIDRCIYGNVSCFYILGGKRKNEAFWVPLL